MQGDIIALTDQDDIWFPQILQWMEETFARDGAIGLVFSDAQLIDENGQSLEKRLWERGRFFREKQNALRDLPFRP